MVTNYEPGTVVRADTPDAADDLLFRVDEEEPWTWRSTDDLYGTAEVSNIRPLVVIDPDDTEQVDELCKAIVETMWKAGDRSSAAQGIHPSTLIAALRSLLPTPTPPKPAEPTGLGAVVEDADGNHWIRTDMDAPAWTGWDRALARVSYSTLDVVRVLSEGVQS